VLKATVPCGCDRCFSHVGSAAPRGSLLKATVSCGCDCCFSHVGSAAPRGSVLKATVPCGCDRCFSHVGNAAPRGSLLKATVPCGCDRCFSHVGSAAPRGSVLTEKMDLFNLLPWSYFRISLISLLKCYCYPFLIEMLWPKSRRVKHLGWEKEEMESKWPLKHSLSYDFPVEVR